MENSISLREKTVQAWLDVFFSNRGNLEKISNLHENNSLNSLQEELRSMYYVVCSSSSSSSSSNLEKNLKFHENKSFNSL